jgi:FkbM family methyltransferase
MYYGQFETDKYISEYFPQDYVGNCIEVGAVDGIELSNTYRFELMGWDCLCIEPQLGAGYFDGLAQNRKKFLNFAISSTVADDVTFNAVSLNDMPANAISGLEIDQKLLEQHAYLNPKVSQTSVSTRRLDWCIEEYFNHETIDFMSIDVEGTELDVLNSFDINAYNTTLYVVENNWNDTDIEIFFVERGWRKDKRIVVNDFYVRI